MLILFFIGIFLGSYADFMGQIFKNDSYWNILIISCIVAVVSQCLCFISIFFLGKSENAIRLSCIMLLYIALSGIIINHYILKQTVHIGSYITLFGIVSILIIHNIVTKNYYDKLKEFV
jgi:hypothetical protein